MAMTALVSEEQATHTPKTSAPRPESFAAQLRAATSQEHSRAEGQEFITSLMSGDRSEADYWLMMAQYLPIYEALETAVSAAKDHPLLAKFYDERLHRTAAIRADFVARFGVENVLPEALPAAVAYAERIKHCSPVALIAHHYLRYLGDLSGGQAIGALVARHYAIPFSQLKMWDFSDIDSPKRVKDAYRARLDEITAEADQAEVLAEARTGYELATNLFAELGAASPVN